MKVPQPHCQMKMMRVSRPSTSCWPNPRKPEADPPLSTVKEIGELPVLHLFSNHLKSFEGGVRNERAGQDHVRRVGRLLYEIDGEPKRRAVDINTFAELRDYLLVQVITESAQQCGAAGNLTLKEFDNGVQHNDDLFVTRTLRHKTAAGGPGKIDVGQ